MTPHQLHSQALAEPRVLDPLTLEQLRALPLAHQAARAEAVDAAVGALYVAHEQTITATDVMSAVVDANASSMPGAKTLLSITGPNTVGKSTIVRRWALERYRTHVAEHAEPSASLPTWRPSPEVEADYIPVAWLTLESATAKTSLDIELLAALGHRLNKAPPVHRTVETAVLHGVRMVVIDDVHFLRTRHVWGRQAMDHLKKLNTELGEHHISIVLVGANLEGGELYSDPQISGRLRTVRLSPYSIETRAGQVAWQRLLKQFEAVLRPWLPGTDEGALYRDAAGLIGRRTQGYLRDVHELMRGAAATAARDGSWAITPDHLVGVALSERATREEHDLLARRRKRAG